MIKKDLPTYALEKWARYLLPVTKLSLSHQRGSIPMVQHEKEMYNFDAICDDLFSKQNHKRPSSADALDISSQVIRLVEFKSGFRPKISRENFDSEKGRCEVSGQVCEEYWKLFFKLQDFQTRELFDSLRAKAVESMLTLEKQILPLCEDASHPIRILYVVVIDADPVDQMENILDELGTQPKQATNVFSGIRKALSRLVNIQDATGNTYCYDEVEVFSPKEYVTRLS